ncbi:MAG: tetratricopeptide repeat protein [Pseudomonadota bacterium]
MKKSQFEHIIARAADGDPFAQVFYGYLLENGMLGKADGDAAQSWYEKAAQIGFAPAQYALSILLDKKGEHEQALMWLKRGADSEYPPALTMLGDWYLAQRPKSEGLRDAIAGYEKASTQGYLIATYKLAMLYWDDRYPEIKDVPKAMKLAKEAADLGFMEASELYGILAMDFGDSSEKDAAISYLKQAEARGSFHAANRLSIIYEEGLCGEAKSPKKTRYYLRRMKKLAPLQKFELRPHY